MYTRPKHLEKWFPFKNCPDCTPSTLNSTNDEKSPLKDKVIKSLIMLPLKNILYEEVNFFDIFISLEETPSINGNIFTANYLLL